MCLVKVLSFLFYFSEDVPERKVSFVVLPDPDDPYCTPYVTTPGNHWWQFPLCLSLSVFTLCSFAICGQKQRGKMWGL